MQEKGSEPSWGEEGTTGKGGAGGHHREGGGWSSGGSGTQCKVPTLPNITRTVARWHDNSQPRDMGIPDTRTSQTRVISASVLGPPGE